MFADRSRTPVKTRKRIFRRTDSFNRLSRLIVTENARTYACAHDLSHFCMKHEDPKSFSISAIASEIFARCSSGPEAFCERAAKTRAAASTSAIRKIFRKKAFAALTAFHFDVSCLHFGNACDGNFRGFPQKRDSFYFYNYFHNSNRNISHAHARAAFRFRPAQSRNTAWLNSIRTPANTYYRRVRETRGMPNLIFPPVKGEKPFSRARESAPLAV